MNRRAAQILLAVVISCSGEIVGASENGDVQFGRDIRPLIIRHCSRCHGERTQEADLNLLSRTQVKATVEQELVVAGNAEASLLYKRLTDPHQGDLMPLDGQPLNSTEIELFERWINNGAEWPLEADQNTHWAYQAPTRPEVPLVEQSSGDLWIQPIDAFISKRLDLANLRPNGRDEFGRILRRASLALTGLPPTPDTLEKYTSDESIAHWDTSYAQFIDECLESRAFGQRWAVHWLDQARYADSNGYQADQLRDNWAYRDWIVNAFNSGKPFDQFVIEQLAGDLLPNASLDQRIATGFSRMTTCNVEAGVHPEENRVNQIFDRVNTMSTVFLGTTLECCQCHDHKYDPFTRREYYQLFAYFNNTPLEVESPGGVQFDFVGPLMELPLDEATRIKQAELRKKASELEVQSNEAADQLLNDYQSWLTNNAHLQDTHALWHSLRPIKVTQSGEGTHVIREDDSILFTGAVPDKSTYFAEFSALATTEPIKALRVEALTDPALPGIGPGRGDAEKTNFVLNEVRIHLIRESKEISLAVNDGNGGVGNEGGSYSNENVVELEAALADFNQTNYPATGAIDNDPATAWAIAPQFHQPHWLALRLSQPLQLQPGDRLRIELSQQYGHGRVLGCVRVAATSQPWERVVLDTAMQINAASATTSSAEADVENAFNLWKHSFVFTAKLSREAQLLRKEADSLKGPTTLVMVEMEKPRETFMFERGNYLAPSDKVSPGTPAALHPPIDDQTADRLGLARWLVDARNPMFARVTVNRWWAEMFGAGIVPTLEDFGTQSEPPSHPELLDWLAVEFVESGYSMKHMLRLMAISESFQRHARLTEAMHRIDPNNTLLSRGPSFRMPAELVRDNALAIAGLLSRHAGGPPVMPYQPDGIWRAVGRNQPTWETASDERRYRRGLYVVWKRGAPYPSFTNFDAPDRASCTVKRSRTNTPLQALTLLNDPAYSEMALSLAERILHEAAESDEARVQHAFRLALCRPPTQQEYEIVMKLLNAQRQVLADNLALARLRSTPPQCDAWPWPIDGELSETKRIEVAAWHAVAATLLNLDETISY